MMHFTCDQCGKEMRPDHDARYIVKIECRAAFDVHELTDEDLDEDHMESLSELLREMEADDSASLPSATQRFTYDLCPDCHERFVRDPLGKDQPQKLFFSEN